MGIIENERKSAVEEKHKADIASGRRVERTGPDTKTILRDEKQSQLFAMFLEEQGEGKLAQMVVGSEAGDLKPEHWEELSNLRDKYLDLMARVKATQEYLSVSTVKEMAMLSPELELLTKNVGAEGVRDAIFASLPEIAIRDDGRYEKIANAIEHLAETRKNVTNEEKLISDICEEYNLDMDEYMEAIRSRDPNALPDLIKKRMGFFRGIGRRLSSTNFRLEILRANRKRDIDTHIDAINTDIQEIASALQITLTENATAKKMLHANLRREKVEKNPDVSFDEMRAMMEEYESTSNEEKVKGDWNGFYDERKADIVGRFADKAQGESAWQKFIGNPGASKKLRSDFANGYLNKNLIKDKQGAWAKRAKGAKLGEVLDFLS